MVMFESVVVTVFQSVFYIKIIFFIFKKLFLISVHQNDMKKLKKNINLKQRKK